MVRLEDLANVIREKAGIYIDDNNKNRVHFFKDEMLVILAQLNIQENEHKKKQKTEDIIRNTVNEVLKQTSLIKDKL